MEIIKLIAIVTPFLITASTVYLRLFIKNEFNELFKVISKEFVSKEVFELEKEKLTDKIQLLEPKSARR